MQSGNNRRLPLPTCFVGHEVSLHGLRGAPFPTGRYPGPHDSSPHPLSCSFKIRYFNIVLLPTPRHFIWSIYFLFSQQTFP